MHFCTKKTDDFFVVIALKTLAANAADCFTIKIKRIKRSDMVTIYFQFTLLPKQSNRQSGARAAQGRIIHCAGCIMGAPINWQFLPRCVDVR